MPLTVPMQPAVIMASPASADKIFIFIVRTINHNGGARQARFTTVQLLWKVHESSLQDDLFLAGKFYGLE